MRNPDQVLSRDQILDLVWGDDAGVAGEQVKLYVGYLRRKLESVLSADELPIETVRGFGYRYRPRAGARAVTRHPPALPFQAMSLRDLRPLLAIAVVAVAVALAQTAGGLDAGALSLLPPLLLLLPLLAGRYVGEDRIARLARAPRRAAPARPSMRRCRAAAPRRCSVTAGCCWPCASPGARRRRPPSPEPNAPFPSKEVPRCAERCSPRASPQR